MGPSGRAKGGRIRLGWIVVLVGWMLGLCYCRRIQSLGVLTSGGRCVSFRVGGVIWLGFELVLS